MKIQGTVDEILQRKYDEIEVPKDLYDIDEVYRRAEILIKKKKRKKMITRISVFSAIFLVGIISIVAWQFIIHNNSGLDPSLVGNNVTAEYNVEINASNSLWICEEKENNTLYILKPECILDYATIQAKNYFYPITKVQAEVIDSVNSEVTGEIEFWVPGGVMTVKELKDSNLEYDASIVEGISDEDNVLVRYSEDFRIEKVEIGKTYLATMYNENGELYVNKNKQYSFLEYNPDTSEVKVSDNDWKKIDLKEYADSI